MAKEKSKVEKAVESEVEVVVEAPETSEVAPGSPGSDEGADSPSRFETDEEAAAAGAEIPEASAAPKEEVESRVASADTAFICTTHDAPMAPNPPGARIRWDCGAGDGLCHAAEAE